MVLIKGILWGLMLAIMLGPVFFGLIKTSMQKGFKAGVIYSLGVSFSDFLVIVLTYLGIHHLMEQRYFKMSMLLAGGIMMIVFGGYYILKKSAGLYEDIPKKKKAKTTLFAKGFFLNILNPAVFFFWFAVVVTATVDNSPSEVALFFAATLVTVFLTDVLKSYIANRIKDYIKAEYVNVLNKFLGVALLITGAKLLYEYYFLIN